MVSAGISHDPEGLLRSPAGGSPRWCQLSGIFHVASSGKPHIVVAGVRESGCGAARPCKAKTWNSVPSPAFWWPGPLTAPARPEDGGERPDLSVSGAACVCRYGRPGWQPYLQILQSTQNTVYEGSLPTDASADSALTPCRKSWWMADWVAFGMLFVFNWIHLLSSS